MPHQVLASASGLQIRYLHPEWFPSHRGLDECLVSLVNFVPTGVLTVSIGAVRVGTGETFLTVLGAVVLGEISLEADCLVVIMGDGPEGQI